MQFSLPRFVEKAGVDLSIETLRIDGCVLIRFDL